MARIYIAHPGATPLLYEQVAACRMLGHDVIFATGFYYDPLSTLAHIVRKFPSRLSQRATLELRRRYHEEVPGEIVRQYRSWELQYIAASRLLSGDSLWPKKLMRRRNRLFDNAVAIDLATFRPDIFIGFDTSCLKSIRAAKATGAIAVMNQVIGHPVVGSKLIREQMQRYPEFADTSELISSSISLDQCVWEAQEADYVLAPSDYVKNTLVEIDVSPSTIHILPYGVRIDRFRPIEKRDLSQKFRLLFVGVVGARKGVPDLLQAISTLDASTIELTLVGHIAGSKKGIDRFRGSFRHIANVPHSQVHELYHNADVFIFPSVHEGSALVIYEALASGLPVITTPNAGSVVRDGVEGFIVPIQDVETLKNRILCLQNDPKLRIEMGRAARKRAIDFSWDTYRTRLGAFINGALDGRNGSGANKKGW